MFEPCSDSDDQQSKDSNPALALDVHPQIDELRNTLRDALPYCSGLAKLPAHSFMLFYGKAKDAKRMNLANASRAELVDLEQCGDIASFGVDQEAVVDPNYRRAMKLDRNYFAINLDVERSGILEAVRTAMFAGKNQDKPIRADLYSLNVYGKDCFFMRHKDTPRGSNMFGSLVLVFPTTHTGGTLELSHHKRSWSFDAASYLENLQADDPRVAYIAFFSDVEHEVRKVTSGYRVTITYNLYYVDEVQYSLMANLRVIQPRGADKPQVKTTLESLLKDETFMPNGGWLGFGLRHLYPLPTSFDVQEGDKCPLKKLHGMLKGIDAALYYACSELLITPPTFYTVFEAQSEAGPQGIPAIVACPRVVKFDSHALESDLPIWQKLCLDWDGVLINFPFERRAHSTGSGSKTPSPEPHPTVLGARAWHVHWVTSLSKANRVTTQFAAYGNEPMIGYLYQCICMLVKIGPPGMRAQEPAKPPPPPSPPAPRCHG